MKDVQAKLKEEIKKLEKELREELPRALKKAMEMGDLRENAEYQTAKERQSYVQAKLAQLTERLSKLSMINLDKIPADRASYGSTVVLYDIDKEEEFTYHLVSSEESDVAEGKISTSSPIGRALMGCQVDDEVQIRTPRGTRNCEILDLKTIHDKAQEALKKKPAEVSDEE
ncbi:MAG TPA: transcription elongation factor GreA [Acidobacteriota bacterium]|nr:transcription elongation factor GreA [Acidobacteriota bacterium]